ncbi:MAG: class I tRNA ligase family protein [Pseudomonadota bacterium]
MDPLDLIDEYGADALRFTMAAMAAQGRNIRLSKQRVEGYRNFGTKLWNAARFCQMNGCVTPGADFDPKTLKHTVNAWIVGEAAKASAEVAEGIETYRFNDAAGAAYRFIWNVFCDWYLELIKPLLNGDDEAAKVETRATAGWVIDQTLKLLHPFMPFLTEELWEELAPEGEKRADFLMRQVWPDFDAAYQNAEANAELDWVVRFVTEVRAVRGVLGVPAGAKPVLTLVSGGEADHKKVDAHLDVLLRLARLERVDFADAPPAGTVSAVLDEATLCLDVSGLIDPKAEMARLKKEIAKLEGEIGGIEKKLSNENFLAKAPEEVVAEQKERLVEGRSTIAKLSAARDGLAKLI